MADIRDQIDGYWDELEEQPESDPLHQLNIATKKWIKSIFESDPMIAYLAGKHQPYPGGKKIQESLQYVHKTEVASWDGSKYTPYGISPSAGAKWAYENYLALPDKGSTGGSGK